MQITPAYSFHISCVTILQTHILQYGSVGNIILYMHEALTKGKGTKFKVCTTRAQPFFGLLAQTV